MKIKYTFGIISFLFLVSSCSKKEVKPIPPVVPITLATVITNLVKEITDSTISTSAHITNDGGSFITDKGIVYSMDTLPNLANANKISSGSGPDSFKINIGGLKASTKYFLRAYATNSKGVAYGNQIVFTTNNIPVDPYKFIFYKDRYSDTTIYSSDLNSYGTTQHSYTIITNKLSLPPGIFLYVTVDTIIGKIYAGIFGDSNQRKLTLGDTMHIANNGIEYTVGAISYYDSFGIKYYSSCKYHIKVGGKAATSNDSYFCKWFMDNTHTMTSDIPKFFTDSTVKCNY